MKKFLLLLILVSSNYFYAQQARLGYQYFRNGEYEKSASIFEELQQKNPYNYHYLNYLIDSYQQLEKYAEAENLINSQLKRVKNQKHLWIELGHNYSLQRNKEKAEEYYQKALDQVEKKPNSGYLIGKTFQDNHLLDYALEAYYKAMKVSVSPNFYFQIASIYAQKGDIEKMMDNFLNVIPYEDRYLELVKNKLGDFISDDDESQYNQILKRLLIQHLQNQPEDYWNQLLSWIFIQEKKYDKALIQEIALYNRNQEDEVNSILVLGEISLENEDFGVAKKCFEFVNEHTKKKEFSIDASLNLIKIGIHKKTPLEKTETQFQTLFKQHGINLSTIDAQQTFAEFLAYEKGTAKQAIKTINSALKIPSLNKFSKGNLKIALGDILVFEGQFSTALIQYSQVQHLLENHPIGQLARFKIAQTSYYKGDFDWAKSQLKILKRSTSQLMSNDALGLNLLISDNIIKDSLRTALKKYAKADLLAYQNKNKEAIDTLGIIKQQFKGHAIEDETLLRQAQLFEKTKKYTEAEKNYLKIISIKKDGILADDAIYSLAELYLNFLNNPEKAKEYYQKILFDYPSSIYHVEARKKFRKLRGDVVN